MSLFNELKRRNVFRVSIAYIIAAWLVMQFADVILNNIEAPSWVFQAIMLLLGIGLLFAIFFAWAFELTPEGIKKEKDVDRTESITHHTGRKLDFTIIAVLVAALGYFVVDKFVVQPAVQDEVTATEADATVEPSAESVTPSIAVLPFVNMSEDASNEYFSDGISEEILNVLAKIRELKVAGRTSSFAFKGQNEDLRAIGEKLNVKTILEGSVRKDDKRQKVRVTVQLINVEDGYHIWSESYDRSLEDIFAIQEEIAREVAAALKIELLGEKQQQLTGIARSDTHAYDWYLQGRSSIAQFSSEGMDRAIGEFKQAIELDPDYLPAQLGLAEAYLRSRQAGFIAADEVDGLAEPYLTSVLRQDPENSEALALMGYLLVNNQDPDFQKAEELLRQALYLDPRNVTAMEGLAFLLSFTNRATEALEYSRQAAVLEPYSIRIQLVLATLLRLRGDLEEAQQVTQKMREIEPDSPLGFYTEGLAQGNSGQLDQQIYWFTRSIERDPADAELPVLLSMTWLDLDDLQMAEKWLAEAEAIDPDHPATLGANIRILLAKEMYSEAGRLATQALALGLDNRWGYKDSLREALVSEALKRGEAIDALNQFRTIYAQEIASAAFDDERSNQLGRLRLAELQLKVDPDSPEARDIIQQEKLFAQRVDRSSNPGYWFAVSAKIAMLEGDIDRAVEYFTQAFELGGFRTSWRRRLVETYLWEGLHDHPGFQQLLGMLEVEAEVQRENAYKLLASLE